ncbi:MAG: hypothetical protein LBE12_02945 [Planctomycetaceae bacterium]|nr:hypothetical protein [Planctomycetaceae bacterium]
MKNIVFVAILLFAGFITAQKNNTSCPEYTGANLNRVAFPIGGLGAGMYCLEGTGAVSHISIKDHLEFFNEPVCYTAICVVGETPEKNVARVVEGIPPDWEVFRQSRFRSKLQYFRYSRCRRYFQYCRCQYHRYC